MNVVHRARRDALAALCPVLDPTAAPEPDTRHAYTNAVDKATDQLGENRPLADVVDDEIGEALETLWGEAAVNTWNARRAPSRPGRRGAANTGTPPQRSRPG